MEPQEDIDIREQFDVRRYDHDNSSERDFTFTQAHLDQGVIANPQMVGMEYEMNNHFPMALRLGKFFPENNRAVYTVRKVTRHPWEKKEQKKNDSIQALYVPKGKEETYQFSVQGSDTDWQLRCTDMIGPKAEDRMKDEIYQFPKNIDDLGKSSKQQLEEDQTIKEIGWREYYNDGIVEGLRFYKKNGLESDNYASQGQHGEQHRKNIEDFNRVKKISIFHDDRFVTGMAFYDSRGNKYDGDIGKPKGNGVEGDVTETFIGLRPGEKIVGVRIQEAQYAGDEYLVGRVGFILSSPVQKFENFHWSYSGQSVNYKTSTKYADQMGSLLTLDEAKRLLEKKGALFPGEDQWAAIQGKDWIQVGDGCHPVGKLHSEFGPPGWGPEIGVYSWRNVFLWKETNETPSDREHVMVTTGGAPDPKTLHVPKTDQQVKKFRPECADQDFQLRVTDMIGPKSNDVMRDEISQYPSDLSVLTNCSEDGLYMKTIKKIGWREYYGNGVMEGLQFHALDGGESQKYGETRRYPNEQGITFEDFDRICKICCMYDDRWLTGLAFFDNKGNQVGKTVGKPKGNGISGDMIEEYIGLMPNERIVGFKLQEARDPGDGGAFMLGRIGFILASPCQKEGYHWSYSGVSVNYDLAKQYASQVGSLLNKEEALQIIAENGALFIGQDQWAAIEGGDWIQVGNSEHAPGTLHSQFGAPGWHASLSNLAYRQVFLWKDSDGGEENKVKTNILVNPPKEGKLPQHMIIPDDVFLCTIKIIQYGAMKEPELIREIVCENNRTPAFDYGPSVAYFQGHLYYFKRILKPENQTLQLFKYCFEADSESMVTGIFFEDGFDDETKIQFFEQPKSGAWLTEHDFLNNTYVSRQGVCIESGNTKKPFKIYCLKDHEKPVLDSIPNLYLSKLAMIQEQSNLKFYIYTLHQRYSCTIPIQEATVRIEESDIGNRIKKTHNNHDYHQDWPMELRKATITLDGSEVSVDYFMVPHHGKQVHIEVIGIDDEEKEKEAAQKVRKMLSRGMVVKNEFVEETTQLDRFERADEGQVTFPAIMPRKIAGEIFEGHMHLDLHRKLWESYDQKSLLLYCFAGREILIATLKPTSRFNRVQDAFAALEYDPTPDSVKVKMLSSQVKTLHEMLANQQKEIDFLKSKIQ